MVSSEGKFKVLVLDDDVSFRKLLSIKLKSFLQPISIVEFSDLSELRGYLSKKGEGNFFDLVILDENLPDGRGRDLLREGHFKGQLVVAISSDEDPYTPGELVSAGAAYFISKTQINLPLFEPLIRGIIERNKLAKRLIELEVKAARMEVVKTLVATLRHEINNPLGVVLSGAYLVGEGAGTGEGYSKEAAKLIESGGRRIKEILDKLCEAVELEEVVKGGEKVIHIPGDEPWEEREE